MNAILLFTIATVINVTLCTIRAICTIKGDKWVSAITNAICYGFYPLIVMLTAKDTVDIITNMIITAIVNFICVWVIKLVEEKSRKDKLWKVEAVVKDFHTARLANELDELDLPYNYIENIGKRTLFNIYCATQKDSHNVRELLKDYNAKYFVTETKNL